MRVTVDRVGRVVIPKSVRIALGIRPNTELELLPDGGGLRLEPVSTGERALQESDGLPILGPVPGAVLTDADVQRLRDEAAR